MTRAIPHLCWLLVWTALAAPALAQAPVDLEVAADGLGVGGRLRAGMWGAMRLDLRSRSPEPRPIVAEWVVRDADGDEVSYRRKGVLNPGREQQLWVYAPLNAATSASTEWRIRILDEETGELLATQKRSPPSSALAPLTHRLIGVLGGSMLGLRPYAQRQTHHEPVSVLTGLSEATLPDRWFGYQPLDVLVWTPEVPDPDASEIPERSRAALREWVRRGGHLVVIPPAEGRNWEQSTLRDLLPTASFQTVSEVAPPAFLGEPQTEEELTFNAKVFTDLGPDVTAIFRDDEGRASVVAHRVGAGRVTVVGVPLDDPRLRAMGLPNGPTFYRGMFGWQGLPADEATLADMDEADEIRVNVSLSSSTLDELAPAGIAMRGTAAAAMASAVLVLGLYWILAGPVAYFVLRARGMAEHSWTVFVVAVLVFTAITWGGALLIRPTEPRVNHFSIIDANAASGRVVVDSRINVFLPRHGVAELEVGDAEQSVDTIASPGTSAQDAGAGFATPLSYEVDLEQPNVVRYPLRATSKRFMVSYEGPSFTAGPSADGVNWVMPQGDVTLRDGVFEGRLTHNLPGPLTNVLLVYAPGGGETPRIQRLQQDWEPREALDLSEIPTARAGQPRGLSLRSMNPLVLPPPPAEQQRADRRWRGFLPDIERTTSRRSALDGGGSASDRVRALEMLSFFDYMPPPAWWNQSVMTADARHNRQRRQLRQADISHWLATRGFIIVGHVERDDVGPPMPLTVDGDRLTGRGEAMVRWVTPVRRVTTPGQAEQLGGS